MTFKNLLDNFNDEEILLKLFELYPDQKESERGYIKALTELRKIKPVVPTDGMKIILSRHKEDGSKWVHTSGIKEGDLTSWAIEFMPWKEWLGMEIDKKTLARRFNKLDIVAHCLWEMTWSGYSNRQVQSKYKSIMGRVKECMENNK